MQRSRQNGIRSFAKSNEFEKVLQFFFPLPLDLHYFRSTYNLKSYKNATQAIEEKKKKISRPFAYRTKIVRLFIKDAEKSETYSNGMGAIHSTRHSKTREERKKKQNEPTLNWRHEHKIASSNRVAGTQSFIYMFYLPRRN